ncbi:MAG: hypothetical protein RRA92_07920 [Gemmatimonadota bacterium]|nr:hypothetical protein [Gemmatimonadota bacterium]
MSVSHRRNRASRALRRIVLTLACAAWPNPTGLALAQEHASHSHGNGPLHFSHPLVTESPSPDDKVRFDYRLADEPGEDGEGGAVRHTLRLEAEYAFTPGLSLEVDAPYTFLDPDEGDARDRLDNVEVGLKYASFALARHGLLLGGGIEFGLPTGDAETGIGSNHVVEFEPFLDVGYQRGRWEIVGFTSFGIPLNENDEDEADLELGWNTSVLRHLTPRLMLLLEFGGEHVFGGEEDGVNVVDVTPGFKVQPLEDSGLQVGAGVSLPLTEDEEFDVRPVVSIFYHF